MISLSAPRIVGIVLLILSAGILVTAVLELILIPFIVYAITDGPADMDAWIESDPVEGETFRVSGKIADESYSSMFNRYTYKFEGSDHTLWSNDDVMDTGDHVLLTIKMESSPLFNIGRVPFIEDNNVYQLYGTPCCCISSLLAGVGLAAGIVLVVKGKHKAA